MITIQRVRVRWTADARGAPHANARRGSSVPAVLPASLPDGEVVIHDVLADQTSGYVPLATVLSGGHEQAREDWLIYITTAATHPDIFTTAAPHHDVEQRTHLYAGRPRRTHR